MHMFGYRIATPLIPWSPQQGQATIECKHKTTWKHSVETEGKHADIKWENKGIAYVQ